MTPVPQTTTLDATCISDGLRPPADLVVRSVHRSALNLVAADGTLVTVADARAGGLPGGILVRAAEAGPLDLRSTGVEAGMPGRLADALCDLGDGRLTIRLVGARRWSPRIPRLDPAPWSERRAWAHARVRAARTTGGIETMAIGRSALEALGEAIAAGDPVASTVAARSLIGLGPGLTPSGDDALTGVAAVLHAVGHRCASSLGAALDDVDHRTTLISAAMLRHAARGDVAERTHRLLAALLAPVDAPVDAAAGAIDAAIRETVAWGATSGSDLLAGVLLALDAVTSAQPVGVAA